MTENDKERRKYRRVKAEVQVEIQKYDNDAKKISSEYGNSKNLSTGGLLLHHDKPLEIPSYLLLSFSLPDSTEKLDFVGKIVRIEELADSRYEIGVMFMRMLVGDFKTVSKFVSEIPEE